MARPDFLSLKEAIAAHVRDGDTIAMEGFTHLIPFAAGHEIIRQKRKGLILIRMTPDIIYWTGNPGDGSLHRMRDAYETGWPAPLTLEEHSHAAMANAYAAGAANLPFAVFRGYRGAELKRVNPNIRSVTCPFTGEELAAVPALRPDVAVIHAPVADREGNVLIEGIVGVNKEVVLAATRAAIVTVEEIVDSLRGAVNSNACVLPGWTIKAIVHVPGGAHPSFVHGRYDRDNAWYKAWDAIARDRDSFLAWMDEHVMRSGPEAFARYAGGRP
jgi:glutaconate CoA-transferase subunit A